MVRWLEIVVVGIYVFEISQSAFLASVIAMLRILPFAPVGPILAMAADRFGVRRAYLILVRVMLALAVLQAVLAALGWIEVWHLAIGALAAGVYWAAELPLRRSMLGSVVPAAHWRAGQTVLDAVYHPLETRTLRDARAAGATTVDGLEMLVRQAALQQREWIDLAPDVAAMRRAALAELSRREPPIA